MHASAKEINETILRLSGTDVSRCMQCGRCSATCPAAWKMDVLPNQVVWAVLNGNGAELLEKSAQWKCLSCLACEERCPRGVSPARVMEAVRLYLIRQQGGAQLSADALENYPAEMPQQALVAAFRKFVK